MARLTYGVLAAALATLIAGFFVSTSSIPLIVSIVCSGLVSVLILFGVRRRLKETDALGDEDPDVTEFEILDLEDEEAPEMTVDIRSRAREAREPRSRAGRAAATKAAEKVLVNPGRAKYHAAGCRFAKGDDLREVSRSLAVDRGYEPCGTCKPG